ncbi:MAG: AAA family ATPase [Bacteroidales bacterium]|nr:AAA family ATPase [Bacteroidales bacterium]
MAAQQTNLEKKQATIVCADIHGIFGSAEQEAIEQSTDLMNTCMEIIESVSNYYGGKIIQFTGKNAILVFEDKADNPKNALDATIEIREKIAELSKEVSLATPLKLQAGIHFGSVIFGYVGSATNKQLTVVGETVDIASKIREMANKDQIISGPETFQQNNKQFDFQVLEPIFIKGKPEPLPVYKVLQRKKKEFSPQGQHSRSIYSEMIGRDTEKKQLITTLVFLSKGKGGILNIIGTPGTGKSRLVSEIKKENIIRQLQWFEGRGLSHGQTLSFHPFTGIIKSWAGIKDEDNPVIIEKKLISKIEDIYPGTVNEIFPFIARFIGLALSGKAGERINEVEPDALDKIMLKTIRGLIIKISASKPVVITIEDLHWADRSTLDLLKSLYGLSRTYPILFINIMRPGYAETSDPLNKYLNETYPENIISVEVSNLGDEYSSALISNLLQSGKLPKSICQTIVKKTNGNPFFIEEVLRSFIDQGIIESGNNVFKINERIESVNIPETINEVLLTRVENLDEKTRNLLDTASVIGRNFYFKVLDEAAETIGEVSERLQYLKNMQFIQESDDEENLEFVFKHALAHQATYDSMVEKKRKSLHLKIAESIEKIFPERINEFYGTLAMHYSKAEYYKKAEEYLVQAGNEALKSAASAEAIDYFKDAFSTYLKNSGDDPDPVRVAELHELIAFSYQLGGRNVEAIEYYDKVLKHYGRTIPKSRIRRLMILISNFLHILFALYSPFFKFNKRAGEHDNKILKIMFHNGKALYTHDSKRWFFEMLCLMKFNTRFDFSSSEYSRVIMAASSVFFNWTGISLSLSQRILELCGKNIEKVTSFVQFEYNTYSKMHQFLEGDWKQDPKLEELYVLGMQRGEFFNITIYLMFCGFINIELGLEKETNKILDKLKTVADEFDSEHTMAQYYRVKAVAAFKFRKMELSFSNATEGIEITNKTGHLAMLQVIYSMRSMNAAITNDLETARSDLKEVKKLMPARKRIKIWYSTYLLTKAYVLTEELRRSPEDTYLKKSLIAACRSAIKQSAMVPNNLIESHRIMGNALWLTGQKKKSFKHYLKSIKAGEKVNGRLELSRTFFELGKRMLSNGASRKVNGMSGHEYIDKARQLFTEMNLAYDLKELDRFMNK